MLKSIIIAISFITAIAVGISLVWPKYQALNSLQTNIAEKSFELQSKEEYFSRVKEVFKETERYEQEISKILSAFPKDPPLPSLIAFFQKIATKTGMSLETISSGGTSVSETKGTKETFLDLKLVGSYHDFKVFISTLEKSIKIIEVENISFSSPAEPEDPFSFALKIRVTSY